MCLRVPRSIILLLVLLLRIQTQTACIMCLAWCMVLSLTHTHILHTQNSHACRFKDPEKSISSNDPCIPLCTLETGFRYGVLALSSAPEWKHDFSALLSQIESQ
ncbi:unnamed protein product [Orchesella dallaii]|uniref:Secreted protein n=1 Tax=Orchesella dallaii TaxID=48710 RepID=A0ABP1PJC9_9HEXA